MAILIGLSGYAQSGKDTVADILVREHGFRRVAFADKLKEVALDVNPFISAGGVGMRRLSAEVRDFGWDGAKQAPEVRRLLQALGESVRNRIGDSTWINAALQSGPIPGQPIVVTDVRYLNEASGVVFRGGKMVRITRPGVGAVNGHISESDMDSWSKWDGYITNDSSIEDLEVVVGNLLADFAAPSLV